MHASELVELAAAVSAQGPSLIQGDAVPSPTAIEQYWTASKCRLDRWSRTLRRFKTQAPKAGPDCRGARWPMMRAVFEEILTGEILTRVFAAVMYGYDRRHGSDVGDPAARSVLVGPLEARHRVLTILVSLAGKGRAGRVDAYQNHPTFRALQNPEMLKGRCGVCEYRYVCGGSRARAYAVTGDELETEPDCVYVPRGGEVLK